MPARDLHLVSTTLASVLLGLCGMVGWGVYDFLGGLLSKRIGSFVPLFWSQAVGAVAVGVVAVAAGTSWQLPGRAVLLVPVAAALYCGGYLFFFAGFTKGEVSVVAATMNLWAVVTMTVAFVVVGQRLSPAQTVGAAAIVLGATVASVDWRKARERGLRASAGIRETVVGAVLFGLYWNVSEVISEDAGWLRTTVLVKTAVVVVLLGIALVGRHALRPPAGSARTVGLLAAMGVIEVGAVAAVNYGLAIGDAILITPIASALSVVTIALAVLVLKERISPLQTLGVALAVAGIITTAF